MRQQLMIDLFMRYGSNGLEYRGAVRNGAETLYSGSWYPYKRLAVRDAERAASRIAAKVIRNVGH